MRNIMLICAMLALPLAAGAFTPSIVIQERLVTGHAPPELLSASLPVPCDLTVPEPWLDPAVYSWEATVDPTHDAIAGDVPACLNPVVQTAPPERGERCRSAATSPPVHREINGAASPGRKGGGASRAYT